MRNEDRRNGVAIPATRRNLLFCKEGEKASVDLVCSRSPCIWKARRIIIIAWPATGDPGDPLPFPPLPFQGLLIVIFPIFNWGEIEIMTVGPFFPISWAC